METKATLRDEFMTLREEIRNTKNRLFCILMVGVLPDVGDICPQHRCIPSVTA